MNQRIYFISLALLFILFSCENQGESSSKNKHENNKSEEFDNSDWMSEVFENRPETNLLDIVIPGTNQSLTNLLNENSVEVRDSISEWSKPIQKELGNYKLIPFSKNQNLSIGQQLKAGVRYFDIRLTSYDNGIWSAHNFISDPIEPVVDEIAKFIADHPKELLIIDFKEANIEVALYGELLQIFIDRLGRKIAQVEDLGHISTIGDVWNSNISVFLLSGYPPQTLRQEKMFFDRDVIVTDMNPTEFDAEKIIKNKIDDLEKRVSNSLKINRFVQTPNDATLKASLTGGPKSVLEICSAENSINSTFDQWFPELYKKVKMENKRMNILAFDQIQSNPKIILGIIEANR